jgi:hypothetical protein
MASLKKKIEGFVHLKQLEHKTWQGLKAFKLKALPEVFAKSWPTTLKFRVPIVHGPDSTM